MTGVVLSISLSSFKMMGLGSLFHTDTKRKHRPKGASTPFQQLCCTSRTCQFTVSTIWPWLPKAKDQRLKWYSLYVLQRMDWTAHPTEIVWPGSSVHPLSP